MNLLVVLRVDIEALIERTAAKLQAERMLWFEDFERWLEAEKKRSLELSSITEKAKAQHQRDREHLEAIRQLVEDAERALTASRQGLADEKAREPKLSQAAETSRVQASKAEDQALIAFTNVTSHKEERSRRAQGQS